MNKMLRSLLQAFRVLQGWEVAHTPAMLPWVRENNDVVLGPGIKERMAMAGAISEEEAMLAKTVRAEYVAALHALMQPGTVMVVPSAPCTVRARRSAKKTHLHRRRQPRFKFL